MLVSTSKIRRQILSKLGFRIKVIKPKFKEKKSRKTKPHLLAQKNAILKLKSVGNITKNKMAVSADTITVVGKTLLDKPKNVDDAKRMLEILQKRRARIITAVALKPRNAENILVGWDDAICQLKKLPKKLQEKLLSSGKWQEIGGGYALEKLYFVKTKGSVAIKYKDPFVKMIKGDVDTVVGFSIRIFKKLLKQSLTKVNKSLPNLFPQNLLF